MHFNDKYKTNIYQNAILPLRKDGYEVTRAKYDDLYIYIWYMMKNILIYIQLEALQSYPTQMHTALKKGHLKTYTILWKCLRNENCVCYHTLAENTKWFNKINKLPMNIDICRLIAAHIVIFAELRCVCSLTHEYEFVIIEPLEFGNG